MCLRADIVPLLPKLSMRARKLTHNGAWEDLLHDTITRALEAEAQFKPGTNLAQWTFTIMRNIYINDIRRNRIDPREPGCDLFMTLRAASARDARDELMDVQRRMEAMPAWAQQILDATVRHDSHMSAMADELHMPVGTVKSRLNRARQMLSGEVQW